MAVSVPSPHPERCVVLVAEHLEDPGESASYQGQAVRGIFAVEFDFARCVRPRTAAMDPSNADSAGAARMRDGVVASVFEVSFAEQLVPDTV